MSIEYLYHEHTGGATGTIVYATTDPGGCYRANGHTHNKINTCPSHEETEYTTHEHYMQGYGCDHCGYQCPSPDRGYTHTCTYPDKRTVWDCGYPINTWTIGCGKIPGVTIESATIVFNN